MKLPVIALRGVTILPKMVIHFDVSRKVSIEAVEQAMRTDQTVFLVTQLSSQTEEPDKDDLYRTGTVATIKQLLKLPNGIVRVLAEGESKAVLKELDTSGDYYTGEVEIWEMEPIEDELDEYSQEAMLRILQDELEAYGESGAPGVQGLRQLLDIETLQGLLEEIPQVLPFHYKIKQGMLEAASYEELYMFTSHALQKETQVSKIKREFQMKVKEHVDKSQKEYILREQMKVIREELGEDGSAADLEQLEKKVKSVKASKEVKEQMEKELNRLKAMPYGSQEATVSRTYLDVLLELPWEKSTKDNHDIGHAQKVLDEDHYGMEKVKERILEYLAVRSMTKKGDAPILCLVGPPGTGKTSIAQSVARALGKKYVRICLGGVRDEAEIRGHRRTYIGAMPGRFATGLKQAGVNNPLMLLDEIDKVSSDYKGDTSSALLEVLDSEQNNKFRDHYVEVPLDLSKVLFIATANSTQTIPQPLLDRMEVIDISSYTENEKFHIAQEHLIGKQMKKNGLKEGQLVISANALKKMIHHYTREAGVRSLERQIGRVCRKAVREIMEQGKTSIKITENNLSKYLGMEKVNFQMVNETDEIGIVRGLAWTSVGGDTLQIEVNVMPGTGKVQLTGQLGDVMKESAQTAISYIRSIGDQYEIEKDFFDKNDIHIHIPEGAIPKDGPSAGITMATAILSAVAERKVKADLAMTGEITLRGRVLPIGGLKEKLLAAKMANIHNVLVPEKNRPDISELSAEITKGLDITYVKGMDEVIRNAFVVSAEQTPAN